MIVLHMCNYPIIIVLRMRKIFNIVGYIYIYIIYFEFLYNVLVKNFYTIIKQRSIFFVLSNKDKTAHK